MPVMHISSYVSQSANRDHFNHTSSINHACLPVTESVCHLYYW